MKKEINIIFSINNIFKDLVDPIEIANFIAKEMKDLDIPCVFEYIKLNNEYITFYFNKKNVIPLKAEKYIEFFIELNKIIRFIYHRLSQENFEECYVNIEIKNSILLIKIKTKD